MTDLTTRTHIQRISSLSSQAVASRVGETILPTATVQGVCEKGTS